MDAGLKLYERMKDSGVEWLGNIPTHWEVIRFKHLLKERNSRSLDGTEQLLRVSQYSGVTKRRPTDGTEEPDTRADSLIGYKCVDQGNLVVNIMLAWNGSLGVSSFPGIVSPAYCVYSLSSRAHAKYLHYLLRSIPYKTRIKAKSTGVVESRLRLYTDDLFRLEAHLPPHSEQTAIVRFLDLATDQIEQCIRAKEKLIALLEEQKQVIIHDAVTGRINVHTGKPYPDYKPSGVQWLDTIPSHWEVRKLWWLYQRHGSGTTPSQDYYFEGPVPWVMSGDLNDGIVETTTRTVSKRAINEISTLKLYPPLSLVIAMYGATIGRTGVLADYACTNQACFVLADPYPHTNTAFYQMVLVAAKKELSAVSFGGGQPNINAEVVKQFRVPLPPVSEQTDIVNRSRHAISGIDTRISQEQSQVILIREYRTRLIADVVSGKLDVREAAKALPDDVAEASP